MIPKLILETILKKVYNFSSEDIKKFNLEAKKSIKNLEDYLLDKQIIEEEKIYDAFAKKLKVKIIDLKNVEVKPEILNLVPTQFASNHSCISFQKKDNELSIAMVDPSDIQTIEFLRRKTGLNIKVFLATPSAMKDALRKYHGNLSSDKTIISLVNEKKNSSNEKDLKKVAEELPIINIVNSILEHAVFEGASDIHIEPIEKQVIVRYRVDGLLSQVMELPKEVQNGIIARVKILAHLKIDEHMIPQDGRFKIQIQDEKLSFRVSIMPVYDGEKIVMRLLHEGQKPLSLEQL
ncbi:MAG: ATPase, T2SS/T4P/T4SS family, partial [Candidatus Pacebacteria bacterium]|nr:ATPase, T2SS/T4P/T4SS family [Candidatus Paceibacterota bacterium]